MAEYARAEGLLRRLHAQPVAERTRADYERPLDAYRAVYHGDPGSPDAAPAVAAVADLLAEEGHRFHDPKLLHNAAAQWKFLRSQYPGSPLRHRARLQEAEIEQHEPRPKADTKNALRRFSADSNAPVFNAVQAPDPIEHTLPKRISGPPGKPTAASIMPNTLRATRLSPAPVAEQQDPIAILQGVRFWTQGTTTRIAVDLSGATPYRVYPAPDNRRIILIFFGARPAESLLEHAIAFPRNSNVRSANVTLLAGNQAELVLQLLRPRKFSSFALSNPDRLVLDVGGASDAKPVQAVASPPEKISVQTPPQTAIAARPEKAFMPEIAANSAPDAQQHSMTRVLGLRVRRIVIDPGHGGHDSGTLGPGGVEEKDVALEVALRLGHLLQQQMGADVIYTRRTDKFVPLEQRTALANRAHADLFLSIHANSSSDPDARGVETYFLNFTASPTALNVAARENAVSNRSVYELSGLVRRITLTDKIDESRAFAEDVQQSLYTGLAAGNDGLKNRGVKQAPFMVLIGAHMPSILVEISFLTNPLDATHLEQPAYRERLAEALYRGVAEYVDGMSGVRVAKSTSAKMIPAPVE